MELLVRIEQEEVGGLKFDGNVADALVLKERCGQIVGKRNLLEADEVRLGCAHRREVVGIVGIAQLAVLRELAFAQDAGHIRHFLVAGGHPAVEERLRHRSHVGIARAEFRIQAHYAAKRVG